MVYARSLMLSQKPGVLEAADRALAAVEKLGWVPETIDALITKGTFLGQVGRLSEARIIIEGAIALAEEHDLGRSVSRGQNNLAYVLVGLDDAASLAVGEEAYRTAQRLGDRSQLLFSVGQTAFANATIGEFEKAEEVLANPLTRDQPPAARVYTGSGRDGDGGLARRPGRSRSARGGGRRTDRPGRRPTAENQSSRPSHWRQPSPEGDWTRRSPRKRDPRGVDLGRSSRHHRGLLVHCRIPWRCLTIRQSLIPSFQRFLPRFRDHFTTCQVLAPAVDGPVDTREIDAVIARRAGWGSVADVVRFSMIAAPFATPDKRAEYLSTARSIATERGWHGILRLIDSHLS